MRQSWPHQMKRQRVAAVRKGLARQVRGLTTHATDTAAIHATHAAKSNAATDNHLGSHAPVIQ